MTYTQGIQKQCKIHHQRKILCIKENFKIVIVTVAKSQQRRKKDKDKGTIALLRYTLPFMNDLLLSNNVFLIKQDAILHFLKGIEETQVKVLRKETGLPDSLLKSFFMLIHDLLLQKQLFLKLLAGLLFLGSS